MKEIIENVEEVFDVRIESDDYSKYDGYRITTNKQIILFGIDNSQCCCEEWGALTTNDDICDFVGSELLGISNVDAALNRIKVEHITGDLDSGDIIFVNIETSTGTLQLTAYNCHNGYYGHEVKLISNQLNFYRNI